MSSLSILPQQLLDYYTDSDRNMDWSRSMDVAAIIAACFVLQAAWCVESVNFAPEKASAGVGQGAVFAESRSIRSPGIPFGSSYNVPLDASAGIFASSQWPSHNILGSVKSQLIQRQPPLHSFPRQPFTLQELNQPTCGDTFRGRCSASRYRTADGSCNNLFHPTWGQANTRYARLLPSNYADGVHAPTRAKSGSELPPARTVSVFMFPPGSNVDRQFSLAMMQWGQIVTHDMAMIDGTTQSKAHPTRCCSDDGQLLREALDSPLCYPILIAQHDPLFRSTGMQCMNFVRSTTDLDRGCSTLDKPAEQLTVVTSYLDASHLYGSDQQTTNSLRTGVDGLMVVEYREGREWPPAATNKSATCDIDNENDVCYRTGDARANQNPQLTILQVMFVREHNRIARILRHINPHWSDETIFQETRRIVIAEHQHITYDEWLPNLLGRDLLLKNRVIYNAKGYVNDYSPDIDPSILNEHSNAAFRYFHSAIAGQLSLVDEKRCPFADFSLRISNFFDKPGVIEQSNNMDDLIRGLATQPEEENDQIFDVEITRYLFRMMNPEGSDLRAIDIQRNRDHGLASYNDFREYCGLPRAQHWIDFTDVISADNVGRLAKLYETPDDVDLTVAGSLEVHVKGALAGPTFVCIIQRQFYRTRTGDRYFWESGDLQSAFTVEQIQSIRQTSIAKFFCNNGDHIKAMQRKGFEIPSQRNPVIACDDIPDIDFLLWKDLKGPETAYTYLEHEDVSDYYG